MDREPLQDAKTTLGGLSVGDAFGQAFFYKDLPGLVDSRTLPEDESYHYTDDTVMAMGIVEVLERHGEIEQDDLAITFARRFKSEPNRGYGSGALNLLESIGLGDKWSEIAPAMFDGTGSKGNGGAMRVAPLGAYFADDMDRCVRQAALSAQVTHAHPDGQAGAIGVAVAAAMATAFRHGVTDRDPHAILKKCFDLVPDSDTRDGIGRSLNVDLGSDPRTAASRLGNGIGICSFDTVPVCLWLAANYLDDFEEAMWNTVLIEGDIDTNCAIVGGIVVSALGLDCIPDDWLARREPLPKGFSA